MHVRVCRQCGYEYRPEISVCTDCGGSLEDRWDNGSGITHATASPAPDVAKESDLGDYQSILVSWLASDLVPLAERLREAGIGFQVSETPGARHGTNFDLLVRDEDAARALAVKAQLDLKTRWTTWAVVGGLAVGIGSLIAALIIITVLITQRGGRATPSGTARVGREAPDFTLRLFDGQTVSLAGLKGKPVLVNFWTSTCPHCQREAPVLVRIYEKYRDKGLAFLSVNVSWDKEGPAKRFVEQYRMPFPVGRDANGKIGALYGVDSTPMSFFISKNGKLVERLVGAPDDVREIEAGLERRVTWLLGS